MKSFPRDTDVLAQIIDDLYAGTLDNQVWARAVISVADWVRATGAVLFAFNPSTGAVLRSESYRFDPRCEADYASYWCAEDPRREATLQAAIGIPVTEQTLSIPGYERSRFYHEFALKVDAPHFMPAWLHKSNGKAVALSMQRGVRAGPFERRDIELYRCVVPHLARAIEIRDRLEAANLRASSLAASLDGLTFGICVLAADGKIMQANVVADRLLGTQCGIRRKIDGTVWLQPPAGTHLQKWLKSGAPSSENPSGLLHVSRPRKLPLTVTVAPFPVATVSWMRGDPRWLMLVFDPEAHLAGSQEIVARDLGLTTREAEVACLLLAGHKLPDIAHRLSVSWHTIRSQLQSIFRKTGVQTQADLMRRMMLGPAMYSRSSAQHQKQDAAQRHLDRR